LSKDILEKIEKLASEIAPLDVVSAVMSLLKSSIADKNVSSQEAAEETRVIENAQVAESGLVQGFDKFASPEEKIALFISLFRGREDVYAKGYLDKKKGGSKLGYAPACGNEWRHGCNKPKVKCAVCNSRKLLVVTDEVIHNHLSGKKIMGAYALLEGDECYFLAIDFDGGNWQKDVEAFRDGCKTLGLDTHIEVSRSGNGAHAWFFFEDKISAKRARRFGIKLLTYAMQLRHEIKFTSYDRLFPNQDIMPKGGFGNLIALPLQGDVRKDGKTVFVDENFVPYIDQWAYLAKIKKLSGADISRIITAIPEDELEKDDSAKPWEAPQETKLSKDDYPASVKIVLADMLYVEKDGLSNKLLHKIKRLAAFKNPEFFKAQAMRLSTYDKARIISCAEDSDQYIHLPRGLLEDIKTLLAPCKIIIEDKRNEGTPIDVEFLGTLRDNQQEAVGELLKHDNGVLSATTAFGKTVVGINLISQLKTNTLILVHRAQLATQWKERLEQFLQINMELPSDETSDTKKRKSKKQPTLIGQVGATKNNPTGIIDIALLQSCIEKGADGKARDFVKNYGLLLVDECHHVSAFSFEKVLKAINAKHVYGLTATPKRQDGHDPIITMQCGVIRYIADNKSEKKSRNFEHYAIPRFTKFSHGEDDDINKIYAELSNNAFRNELIVKDVVAAYKQGHTPIILCNRKDHVHLLAKSLEPHCDNVVVLIGGAATKDKKTELERLKTIAPVEPLVIVATGKYIGEGFDEPRLDTLFLAAPISWRGTLEQYVGRLHRNYEGKKEVLVYDYADIRSRVLEKMYHSRLKGYAALGYLTRALGGEDGGAIYDETNFAAAFYNDIAGTKKTITISSPYLHEKSVRMFLDAVADLTDITIEIHTKKPSEKTADKVSRLIELLKATNIKVRIHNKLHQKYAIIDSSIVWYGGINVLGAGFDDESIMRIPSREIAVELEVMLKY